MPKAKDAKSVITQGYSAEMDVCGKDRVAATVSKSRPGLNSEGRS